VGLHSSLRPEGNRSVRVCLDPFVRHSGYQAALKALNQGADRDIRIIEGL
jgi:hypothetical protein